MDDSENWIAFSNGEDDKHPYEKEVRMRMVVRVKMELQGWY